MTAVNPFVSSASIDPAVVAAITQILSTGTSSGPAGAQPSPDGIKEVFYLGPSQTIAPWICVIVTARKMPNAQTSSQTLLAQGILSVGADVVGTVAGCGPSPAAALDGALSALRMGLASAERLSLSGDWILLANKYSISDRFNVTTPGKFG